MVKHIVIWKTKESNKKGAEEVKKTLEALKEKIDVLKHIEVGINFNPSEAAWDIALYSEFDSAEDLNAYQVHPAHVEAAGFVKTVVSQRAVVDYII